MTDKVWLQMDCYHYVYCPYYLVEYAAYAGLYLYCFECHKPRGWRVANVN